MINIPTQGDMFMALVEFRAFDKVHTDVIFFSTQPTRKLVEEMVKKWMYHTTPEILKVEFFNIQKQ